jgi:hypothetical protein
VLCEQLKREAEEAMTRTATVIAALGLAIGLAACAGPPQAEITDLEDDKVVIFYPGDDMSIAKAAAEKGCGIHGKTAAGPVSSFTEPSPLGGLWHYIFACR